MLCSKILISIKVCLFDYVLIFQFEWYTMFKIHDLKQLKILILYNIMWLNEKKEWLIFIKTYSLLFALNFFF